MGCGASTVDTKLEALDDSVRVMLEQDKKRQREKQQGEIPKGYVPRAEHPLFREATGDPPATTNAITTTADAAR